MKKLAIIVSSIVLAVSLVACNKQVVDLTYSYERAIISLPNGEIVEGKVQSWTDYEDGDQIQVKIDGVTYLLHASQIVLISE
jgi:ribosomal protein S1